MTRPTRQATVFVVALGSAAVAWFVLFGYVGIEPIFRDRSMRPPDEACPRMDIGPRQCAGIVTQAIERSGVDPAIVVGIGLGRPEGQRVELGGSLVATARLDLADGRSVDQEVWCIGVGGQNQPWCTEDPLIQLWMGANHDVPCDARSTEGAASPACAAQLGEGQSCNRDVQCPSGRCE